MKIINSKLHGLLDYLVSLILIISPWLFGFADGGPQMWVPIILGISSIVYSLLTNYELGAIRIFSFKTHLTFDALSGILLAASPWIFRFADDIYMPHLIFGVLELVVVALTKSQPAAGFANVTRKPAL
jgi:hypothetical protein